MHSHLYNAHNNQDGFEGCIVYWAKVGFCFHYKGKMFVPVTGTAFPNKNNFSKYVYSEWSITSCDL